MQEGDYVYLNTSLIEAVVPFITRQYGLGNPVNLQLEVIELGKVRIVESP